MSELNKQETYFLYRYQLVPITQKIQMTLDLGINSYEDLVNKKNDIFKSFLSSKKVTLKAKTEALYKIIYSDKDEFLIRIGSHKKLKRHNKEFNEESIEDYPNVLVYINNDSTKQFILIEKNNRAFTSPDVVATMLEQSFKNALLKYQLALYIKPIIEKREFWKVVKEYDQKIRQLTFELIKPNLSNISKTLSEDLKSLQSNTNSHNTKLELNSAKGQVLENIDEDNQDIEGLVNYSSEGGGDIFLKIKGMKKKIKASKKVHKEITVQEIDIKGRTPEQVLTIFNQLME
ncbi:MAG: hypothetical protein KGZ85_16995 [Ignavibacterium sp.]|nr:hypothetical protein [Ignavibacterium sp.]